MPAPDRLVHRRDMLVFEGDSLTNRRTGRSLDTWPYLHLMQWQETWADILSQWLFAVRPDLRLGFHNAAVGGSTCRSMAERYAGMVKPHRPSWVLFTLGSSDAVVGIRPTEMRERIGHYAERLQADSGGRLLYVIAGERARDVAAPARPLQRRRMQLWRACGQAVTQHGGVVVDCLTVLARKQRELRQQWDGHSIHADGGHFNGVGHRILLNEVLRALHLGGC